MRARFVAAAEVLVGAAVVLGHNVWQVLPNEVPILLALGWVSLRLHGGGWRSVGLSRPASWKRSWGVALAVAAASQATGVLVLDPLLQRLFHRGPDLSSMAPLVGNTRLALLFLAVIWTFAAFGEELVFRGYLMNRAADALGRSRTAWGTSLVLVAVLFGFAHFYKGAPGMIDSGLSALVLGGAYLASGRNLWLPILAHGLIDTIGLGLIYFGLVAGLP